MKNFEKLKSLLTNIGTQDICVYSLYCLDTKTGNVVPCNQHLIFDLGKQVSEDKVFFYKKRDAKINEIHNTDNGGDVETYQKYFNVEVHFQDDDSFGTVSIMPMDMLDLVLSKIK